MQAKSFSTGNITSEPKIQNFSVICILIVAALSPGIAMFGGIALTPAYIIAAIVPFLFFLKNGNYKTLYASTSSRLMWALLAYSLISLLWTLDVKVAANLWFRMLFMGVSSVAVYQLSAMLDKQQRILIAKTLVAGVILSVMIANVEIYSDGLLNRLAKYGNSSFVFELVRLNRGSTYITLMIWPLVAYLLPAKNRILLAAILAAIFLTVIRLESQSAVLGMVAGVTVFLLVYSFKEKAINIIAGIMVAGIFCWPVAAKHINAQNLLEGLPSMDTASVEYRLEIWRYTAKRSMEKPLLGWGFDSSRNMPIDRKDYVSNGRSPIPLHPHNNVLQVWLELGTAGLILFTCFLFSMVWTVKKSALSKVSKASFMALMANYFAAGFTGFGIWQNWWIAAGLLAVIFLWVVAKQESGAEDL